MYLDKNSLFFGYPASLVRKVFRKIGGDDVNARFFSHHMGIHKAQANMLIQNLIKEGYLEPKTRNNQDGFVATTIKGNSLAMASFAAPITKRTADQKIDELIERAKIVNTSSDYLYKVTRIAVFGSYLTNKDRINDIDVDVLLEPKYPKEIQRENERAFTEEAVRKGKRIRNFIEQLCYPLLMTRKFLQHRSRALSLHYGDGVLDMVEYKIVFELKNG